MLLLNEDETISSGLHCSQEIKLIFTSTTGSLLYSIRTFFTEGSPIAARASPETEHKSTNLLQFKNNYNTTSCFEF